MFKRVNIYPMNGPITNVVPPIRVALTNVSKDVKDIRKCIMAGARVEELVGNTKVTLDLSNYDIDNGAIYTESFNGVRTDDIEAPREAASNSVVESLKSKYEFDDPTEGLVDPLTLDPTPDGESIEYVVDLDAPKPEETTTPAEDETDMEPDPQELTDKVKPDEEPVVITSELPEDEAKYLDLRRKLEDGKALTKRERRFIRQYEEKIAAAQNVEADHAVSEEEIAGADDEEEVTTPDLENM